MFTTLRLPRETDVSNDARCWRFGGAHVTCLDCGLEFKYGWAAMRIGQAEVSNKYDFERSARQVAFCEALTASTPATPK